MSKFGFRRLSYLPNSIQLGSTNISWSFRAHTPSFISHRHLKQYVTIYESPTGIIRLIVHCSVDYMSPLEIFDSKAYAFFTLNKSWKTTAETKQRLKTSPPTSGACSPIGETFIKLPALHRTSVYVVKEAHELGQ